MKTNPQNHSESVKKLAELIRDIKVAMFTSIDSNGHLHSRPMMTQKTDFDGDLWFFTSQSSAKVFSLQRENQVNVSYSDPQHNTFVSVCGQAEVVHDFQKKEELWNPALRAWWPDGLEDPDVALLKVSVHSAQYWDAPNSKVVQMAGFIKALLTHEEFRPGVNEKIDLHH